MFLTIFGIVFEIVFEIAQNGHILQDKPELVVAIVPTIVNRQDKTTKFT